MDRLTLKSENIEPDQETLNAQKQWEQYGTVTDQYLRQTLGDISQEISILPAETNREAGNNRLDKALLKRAQSIIDGFDRDDVMNATINMESLRGVILGLWESAANSTLFNRDILAALESAILSIEIPSEDQLSVFREAINDLESEILTASHVDIIRQRFIANGFSPLALLDEVEDGDNKD